MSSTKFKRGAARGKGGKGKGSGGAAKKGKGGGVSKFDRDAEARATFFDGEDDDEELSSDDDADGADGADGRDDDDVAAGRTDSIEQARLRIARKVLDEVKRDTRDMRGSDSEDDDSDAYDGAELSARLAAERQRALGDAFEPWAADLAASFDADAALQRATVLKGHRGPVTCMAFTDAWCFSGSKDNAVAQHDLTTGQLLNWLLPRWPRRAESSVEDARAAKLRPGAADADARRDDGVVPRQSREAEVLALAASACGRYVAAGGRDSFIHLWDVRSGSSGGPAATFRGHKGAVSALCFQDDVLGDADGDFAKHMKSLESGGADDGDGRAVPPLYSAGDDGSVKHWETDRRAYIETLYGHEGPVRCLDCGYEARPLSGARDRSCRSWKIKDDSHLVYRSSPAAGGFGASVDALRVLDRDRFVSGGDDGCVSLWGMTRKKPFLRREAAHGFGSAAQTLGNGSVSGDASGAVPRWITALGARRGTDVVFSGSCDGALRLWRVGAPGAGPVLDQFASVPVLGFVNAVHVAKSKQYVAAAAAHEHRLGRWERVKKATNAVLVIPLGAAAKAA
ncbi:WD40-repeat-containing domain protein [Pelagophyceae sp. CCMP2097]|nr:WD40-repeat-containing domain protein [Pelagophyceae sp. CCMP2097]